MLHHHKILRFIIAKTVEKVYSYILNISIFFSHSVEYHILRKSNILNTTFCILIGGKWGHSPEKRTGGGEKIPVDTGRGILYNNHYAV